MLLFCFFDPTPLWTWSSLKDVFSSLKVAIKQVGERGGSEGVILFGKVIFAMGKKLKKPRKNPPGDSKSHGSFCHHASFGMLVMSMQNMGLIGMMTVEWPGHSDGNLQHL